jgi:type IV pilus assembly protein PilB
MSRRLGEILIARGALDAEQLAAALSDQRAFGGKLGRTLVDLGYVTDDQLVKALAEQLDLDTVDLDGAEIQPDALARLPVDACERHGVFPVKVDPVARVLWVATAEPDRNTLQEVARAAQHTVEPVLASMSSIDRAIRRHYFGEKPRPAFRLGEPLSSIPGDAPKAPARSSPAPSDDPLDAMLDLGLGPVPPGQAQDAVQELKSILLRLEKSVNAQARAFRALVDLLQDKGIVRRGELGARTSKK